MSSILLHQLSTGSVESRHGGGGTFKRFNALFGRYDAHDAVPQIVFLIHPLVSVDGDLRSERLGKDENVTDARTVGCDESV